MKIATRDKKENKSYNIDILRQPACMIINLIKIDSFTSLFNCCFDRSVLRLNDDSLLNLSQMVDA